MPPRPPMAIPGLALAVLIASCFGAVLFRGEQFAYRDAGHYYYPLHLRTAQQWRAGHLPLWDPSENGGMPLLGNPTAAVLYPGKLVFAIFPFAWASRMYLIGHVLVAFAAMIRLLRGLGISPTGASLGGLSYAFGGPVLFLYSNAIYLVGAAWLPLGFLMVDGWLRRGHARSLAGLAIVLCLEFLGGDLQTAYVLGLFATLYAAWLGRTAPAPPGHRNQLAIVAGCWVVGTPLLAYWLPGFREWGISSPLLTWLDRIGKLGALLGVLILIGRMLRPSKARLSRGILGLLAAAAVGFALAGAQMVPVAETALRSSRFSGEKAMDVHLFSVEPFRLPELAWPGVFGREFPENRLWLLAIPPVPGRALWTASLYAGTLTLVLAIAGMTSRTAPPWRRPMLAMGLMALVLAMGRFGGPLWLLRTISGGVDTGGPGLFRPGDGQVRDAFGSLYALFAWIVPGFGGFRYPAKFLAFALLAFSTLAALGWDGLADGSRRAASRSAMALVGLALAGLLLSFAFRAPMLAWFEKSARVPSAGGPLDPSGCLAEIRRAFLQGLIVAAAGAFLVSRAARGGRFAAPAAILVMALDLAAANARIVWSVPQSDFDREPRALKILNDAEAQSPQDGPFRIHRVPIWRPVEWFRRRSPDRLREIVSWERDTLQAGYGSPYGVAYAMNPGTVGPIDFDLLFDFFPVAPEGPIAREIGGAEGASMLYFPRRVYDLWGARYFLLPSVEDDWSSPQRAIAAFSSQARPIHPLVGEVDLDRWRASEDWQVARNLDALPRAWVVHQAQVRETLPVGSESADARSWRRAIQYKPDRFWEIPGRPVEDPRRVARIEADDPKSLRLDLREPPGSASETVRFESNEPGRVALVANLAAPGLVLLSDTFDPGWKLTIDDRPATILRANRMMRAARVAEGTHRLVFSYEPASLRLGLSLSALGLLGLAALGLLAKTSSSGKESPAWAPSRPSTTPPTSG